MTSRESIGMVDANVVNKIARLGLESPLSTPALFAAAHSPMRIIVGISLLLFGTGTVLCEVECQSAAAAASPDWTGWVRTTDGWERPQGWQVAAASPPRLHPLVVAAGQGLVSVFALVACQVPKPQGGTISR